MLFVGDVQIAQSNSILRYAGKLTKFYPTDNLEAAKVDELVDAIEDIANTIAPSLYEKDEETKIKMRQTLANETLPKWFTFLESRITKFGSGNFAVGSSFTIADFKIASSLSWITGGTLDHIPTTIIDNYPRLKAIRDNVYSNEKVKEWLEKQK